MVRFQGNVRLNEICCLTSVSIRPGNCTSLHNENKKHVNILQHNNVVMQIIFGGGGSIKMVKCLYLAEFDLNAQPHWHAFGKSHQS